MMPSSGSVTGRSVGPMMGVALTTVGGTSLVVTVALTFTVATSSAIVVTVVEQAPLLLW